MKFHLLNEAIKQAAVAKSRCPTAKPARSPVTLNERDVCSLRKAFVLLLVTSHS
jgi:hypothetical protein